MRRLQFIVFITLFSGYASGQAADYIMKSRALIEAEKNSEAAILLTEAVSKGTDSRYYVYRGDALTALGRYEEAIKDYAFANQIEPSSGDYGLARIYAMAGNASRSLGYLSSHLESRYKKSEKEIMLDPAFSKIENTPEWRLFWKTDRYSVPETKSGEIQFYINSGRIKEAKEVLAGLLRDYPSASQTIYAKALVDYHDGRCDECAAAMLKLTLAEKDKPVYEDLLAKARFCAGNVAGAISVYSGMIDAGIPDAGLFLRRAECFRKTGEYDKALKDVLKYLEFYPSSREGLRMAGKTASAAGDNLKGISFFSRNIELNPGDPECFTDRADSYFTARSWELAVNDYGMALDIKPDIPDAWLNKGIALINLGKTDDGCHDLRRAFSLGNKRASPLISRYCIR